MKVTYDGGIELTLDAVDIEFDYYSHDAGNYYTPEEGGYVEITSIKYNGVEVMSWIPEDDLEYIQEATYEREKDRDGYSED
ncbi:MAG: hypothetical protein CL867_12120 [Cytophagaceae bacterium]|nr:hypothetical protein [Cytophagaceae bacterium]